MTPSPTTSAGTTTPTPPPTDFLSLLLEQSNQLKGASPIKERGDYLHLPSCIHQPIHVGSNAPLPPSEEDNRPAEAAAHFTVEDRGDNPPSSAADSSSHNNISRKKADTKRDPFRHIPRSLVKRRVMEATSHPRDPLYELDHPTVKTDLLASASAITLPPITGKKNDGTSNSSSIGTIGSSQQYHRNQQQVLGVLMHKKPHRVGALTVMDRPRTDGITTTTTTPMSPLQLLISTRDEATTNKQQPLSSFPEEQQQPLVSQPSVIEEGNEEDEEEDPIASSSTLLVSNRNSTLPKSRVVFSPRDELIKTTFESGSSLGAKGAKSPATSDGITPSNAGLLGAKFPKSQKVPFKDALDSLKDIVQKYSNPTTGEDRALLSSSVNTAESEDPLRDMMRDLTSIVDQSGGLQRLNSSSHSTSFLASEPSTSNSIHRGLGGMETSSYQLRRGSAGHPSLAAPFVSHLVKKCISPSSSPEAPVFVHWRGMVAILFIDMSGYSKLTTALAPFGAHALSEVINSYMEEILTVVDEHDGDVLKFAGDAIMVAWPSGDERKDIQGALKCALALQDRCGSHFVPQVNHTLHLHIGCVYGNLTSHVSLQSAHKNMPRAYHAVSGPIFRHIGVVVDTAKSGEVCVDRDTAERVSRIIAATAGRRERDQVRQRRRRRRLKAGEGMTRFIKRENRGKDLKDEQRTIELQSFTLWETNDKEVMLVERDTYNPEAFNSDDDENSNQGSSEDSSSPSSPSDDDYNPFDMKSIGSDHGGGGGGDEDDDENAHVENLEEILDRVYPMFLHPSLLLRLGSVSHITHVMEMRFLVVLFIRMNDDSTFVVSDWFTQVLAVLEASNAPAVQLIDDDKGVHIVAAINLYTSVLDPVEQAVTTASRLVSQELGCTIGVAAGTSFCGVIGATTSSRWDIAGACAVRACRLMQYAQDQQKECMFDSSIYESCRNLSLIREFGTTIVKGSSEPIKVYTLNASSSGEGQASWMIVSDRNRCNSLYANELQWLLQKIINSYRCCSVAVIDGPAQSGKLMLAVRAISSAHQAFNDGNTPSYYSASSTSGIVPLIHVARPDGKPLNLALTISSWFRHSLVPHIAFLAHEVASSYERGETGKVIRLLRELVNESVDAKFRVAIIIKHAHFLDSVSLSFVRYLVEKGLLSTDPSISLPSDTTSPDANAPISIVTNNSLARSSSPPPSGGKFIIILTTSPVYGAQSARAIVGTLMSQVNNDLPPNSPLTSVSAGVLKTCNQANCFMSAPSLGKVKLATLSEEEASKLIRFRLGWDVGRELIRLISRKAGSVPGFIDSLIAMIQAQRPYITHLNVTGHVRVQPHQNLRIRNMPWTVVAAMTTTSLLRLYDELPAKHKVLLRLIAALTQRVGNYFSLEAIHQVFKRVMKKSDAFFSLLLKLADLRLITIKDIGLEYAVAAKLISQSEADIFLKRRQAMQRQSQLWINDHSPEEDLSLSAVVISLPPLRDALALTLLPLHTIDLSRRAINACGEVSAEISTRHFASNPVVRQRHQQYLLGQVSLMRVRAEICANKEIDAQHTLQALTDSAHQNYNQIHNDSPQREHKRNQDAAEKRASLVEMLRRQSAAAKEEDNDDNATPGSTKSNLTTEERLWAHLIDAAGVESFEFKWKEHVAKCEKAVGGKVDPNERWVQLYGEGFNVPTNDDSNSSSRKNSSTLEEKIYSSASLEADLPLEKMSLKIVQAKNYVAPLALGNLGGHLMDAGISLREMYTAAVRSSSDQRPDTEQLCLSIGKYLEEADKLAKFVNYEGPFSEKEMKSERSTLLEICCTPRDATDVLSACEIISNYWETTIKTRKEFLETNAWKYAGKALLIPPPLAACSRVSIIDGVDEPCPNLLLRLKAAIAVIFATDDDTHLGSTSVRNSSMRTSSIRSSSSAEIEEAKTPDEILQFMVQHFIAVSHITADLSASMPFDLQCGGSCNNPTSATIEPKSYHISNSSFERALLVLAQAPWSPRHKRHSLEAIRDGCLRYRTETFAGLLCSLIVHVACAFNPQ